MTYIFIDEDVGKRMKQARGKKGIKNLADYLGVGERTLRGYEKAETKIPAYIVAEYSKKFHVSLDYLYYGNEISNTELCEDFGKLSPKMKKAVKALIKACI